MPPVYFSPVFFLLALTLAYLLGIGYHPAISKNDRSATNLNPDPKGKK